VTARVSGPAVHAFQQQQQPHQQQPAPLQQAQAQAQAQAQQPYGDSTAASRDGALSAALGTKWAHAVNVRLVLERRQAGRFVTVRRRPDRLAAACARVCVRVRAGAPAAGRSKACACLSSAPPTRSDSARQPLLLLLLLAVACRARRSPSRP
jgi:hypothetical protein